MHKTGESRRIEKRCHTIRLRIFPPYLISMSSYISTFAYKSQPLNYRKCPAPNPTPPIHFLKHTSLSTRSSLQRNLASTQKTLSNKVSLFMPTDCLRTRLRLKSQLMRGNTRAKRGIFQSPNSSLKGTLSSQPGEWTILSELLEHSLLIRF